MTREMIWKLDQFQELFKHAKEVGLDDALFAVLGGVPSRYELMQASIKTQLQTGQDPRHVIGDYLCDQIFNTIQLIEESKDKSHDMVEIIKSFDKDKNCIIRNRLSGTGYSEPDPNMIFDEGMKDCPGYIFDNFLFTRH